MRPEGGLSGRALQGTDAAGQVKGGRGNQGLTRAEVREGDSHSWRLGRAGLSRQPSPCAPVYQAGKPEHHTQGSRASKDQASFLFDAQSRPLQSTRHPTPEDDTDRNEVMGVTAG